MLDPERLRDFAAYFSFASFGGFLGHLMRIHERKEKFNWGAVILESIAAGFVGLIALLLCKALGLSMDWSGVVVGMSGWMGASATLRLIEVLVYNKLGLKPKRRQSDKEERTNGNKN